MFRKMIASFVCVAFIATIYQPVAASEFSISRLPTPGTMVGLSSPFAPLALKGIVVNLQKPLEFQFIVDTGKGPQDTTAIKEEANRLVKYFLAGLTIPEGDLWVNLSPYEKDRMVPDALGRTDLGRDLLAQDYILKQLTASLIYPEKDLGKEFWARVYKKAQEQFGTTNIPVNTFNKVWILPDQAQVFENKNAAYVTKSTLKVMLDEDYLALAKHQGQPGDMSPKGDVSPSTLPSKTGLNTKAPQGQPTNALASQIVREIILPEIEKEVNTGTNFAPLRQIYQALILAKWYKETVKNALLEAVYFNQKKTAGVNLDDLAVKEQIYNRYLQAYKKGVFNYIKEDPTPGGQSIPRKYFSGGITKLEPEHIDRSGRQADVKGDGAMVSLTLELVAAGAAVIAGGLAIRLGIQKAKQKKIEEARRLREAERQRQVKEAERLRLERLKQTDSKAYADELAAQMGVVEKRQQPIREEEAQEYNRISDQLHGLGDSRGDYIYEIKEEREDNPDWHGDVDIAPRPDSFGNEPYIYLTSWEKVKRKDRAMSNTPEQTRRAEGASRVVARIESTGGYQSEYSDYIPQKHVYYNQAGNVIFREEKGENNGLPTYEVGDIIPDDQTDQAMLGQMPPSQDAAMLIPFTKKWYLAREVWNRLYSRIPDIPEESGWNQQQLANKLFNEAYRLALEGYDFNVIIEPGQYEEHYGGYQENPTSEPYYTVIKYRDARIIRGDKLGQAMLQTPQQTTKDNAALAKDLGGIDLNQINVNREGKAVVVQFDPAQLNELMRDGFEGFTPVIINITPIQSPLPLLGVNPRKEEALEVAAAAS